MSPYIRDTDERLARSRHKQDIANLKFEGWLHAVLIAYLLTLILVWMGPRNTEKAPVAAKSECSR